MGDSVGDNSYEAYKRDFVRDQTRRKNLYKGKGMLVIGVYSYLRRLR